MEDQRYDIPVQIGGQKAHLATLSLRDLTDYLLDFEAAILATAEDNGIELPAEQAAISLVGIEENCVLARLAIMLILLPAVTTVNNAIRDHTTALLADSARKHIIRIGERVEKNQQTFRILAIPEKAIEEAIIAPGSAHLYEGAEITSLVRSQTTIYGKCIAVEGPRPRAKIISAGVLIKAYGSEEQIRSLGRLIFDNVRIDGIGSWTIPDWELKSIEITQIDAHPYISPVDAFNELRNSSSLYWNDVNARFFIKKVRHG